MAVKVSGVEVIDNSRNITTNIGTVDGRDIAADGAKLDGIEAGADVTDSGNVEPLVDTHLNTSSATSGQYLGWNGADYAWSTVSGYTDADVDTHLNTGTAASGEFLSWNGSDYDWIPSPSPELYAENPSSPTAPIATGANSVAIGSGSDVAAAATGGFAAGHLADVNNQYAIAGPYARGYGNYGVAFGYEAQSSAQHAVAIGANSGSNGARSLGSASIALGGSYASGTDSFAAAIANNTSTYGATGANSVAIGDRAKATGSDGYALGNLATASAGGSVALGSQATASGTYSYSLGYQSTASQNYAYAAGRANSASGTYSCVWGGYSSSATASSSTVLNGFISTASHDYATAIGAYARTRADHAVSFGSSAFGIAGAGQSSLFTLIADTTDATPEALTSKNSAPATDNQVILPNNSAYAFHGTIVARQQASAGTACAAWKIEGLIRREGSAGTTVLVNSATTVLDNTPSWGMALSADTTNGGLAITVTGAAATNIRWVATIHTSEVTY